jgi:hypothetical protein
MYGLPVGQQERKGRGPVTIAAFDPVAGLLGGALIGLAVVLLFWLNGRIAGISGIVAGALARPGPDTLWRWLFLAGLVAAALAWPWATGRAVPVEIESGPLRLVAAGLLVGFGARLGCGCTSGHGIAGLARFSRRSAVAVATFFAFALATATLTGLLTGGGR